MAGLALCCVLVACSSILPGPAATPVAGALDQPFALRVGQSVTLAPEGLAVRFARVSEDSRCPSKVNCYWSGLASLDVALSRSGQPDLAYTLSTRSNPYPTDRMFYLEYELQLKTLEPRREYLTSNVPQDAYVATFVVTKHAMPADCPPRPDDPGGYLRAICRYLRDRNLSVAPADPAGYHIKRLEERIENRRAVLWAFLDCCGMGDIAVIDRATGEITAFRRGAY
jgi:hypothetical protein